MLGWVIFQWRVTGPYNVTGIKECGQKLSEIAICRTADKRERGLRSRIYTSIQE